MIDKQDQSSKIVIIAMCGVLSSFAVLLSIELFFQRSGNDPFFASEEYMFFKERNLVKNIRREIAEEFVGAVVNCISPPILPGQSFTEQEANDRVMAVLEKYSESNEKTKDQTKDQTKYKKCENSKNPRWTFALPCKVSINRSPHNLRAEVKLDDMNICKTAIATSIHSAAGQCTASANFPACLVTSVLANEDVKKEIDKPVEIQPVKSK